MVQTAVLPLGALQVPEPAVAVLSTAPGAAVPVTVILEAGSGPSLATVNVVVTMLPALTMPAGVTHGATQLMTKSLADPHLETNASMEPLSELPPGPERESGI